MAERIGRSIKSEIPPAAQEFLRAQPMLVLGGQGRDGRVWASLLSGEPGFARAIDDHTLGVQTQFHPGDPLGQALQGGEIPLGALAIEPATRRRMRLNGLAQLQEGGLLIQAREVYANCPKYIQKREWHWEAEEADASVAVREGSELEVAQAEFIAQADTFFIASRAPQGADASHRGGAPGFVRVLGPNVLQFPDYAGNAMFNTLGNLQRDGRAGLLFPDWRSGATLQVSGQARVLWDAKDAAWPGAERAVELRIERVLERSHATRLRWQFLEASPFNPEL